jgi:hypothetical protein
MEGIPRSASGATRGNPWANLTADRTIHDQTSETPGRGWIGLAS